MLGARCARRFDELRIQPGEDDAAGGLAAGAEDEDLLADGGRAPGAGGAGALGEPGQPAGEVAAGLDTAARGVVVDGGDAAEADEVVEPAQGVEGRPG